MTELNYNTLHSFQVTPDEATPMVRQFLEVKREYPGIILFYRMGDFYETFFEDAIVCARVLEITLTGRDAGKAGRIPMAGVPVKAAENYMARLLSQNFKVAVCEQMEDPAEAKGLVKRKVVRVLSSGTITEQSLLKAEENNYLAAIANKGNEYALAYCDITTGAFSVTELGFAQLLSELDRTKPAEVLVKGRVKKAVMPDDGFDETVPDALPEITENYRCTPVNDLHFDLREAKNNLQTLFNVTTLEGFALTETESPLALQAAGAIARYVRDNFVENPPVFDGIRRYALSQAVSMNATARRNLELLSTVKNNQYEGSLLWVLNKTVTSMGARLLRHWLSQPITYLPEIQSRHDGVEELVNQPQTRESVRQLLGNVYDIERLSAKVANLTAQPRDLVALRQSVSQLPGLSTVLKTCGSFYLSQLQDFPPELFKAVALIEHAVDDSPAMGLKEGGYIKTGYHQELDRLRDLVANHEAWLRDYEEKERERTGIKTLKVSFNSAFGYFIEISRANAKATPEGYTRKQTLTNAERFTTDVLKTHEGQVLDAQSRQYDLEYQLFIELRQKLLPYAPVLKECAQRVAALDVLQSLASVAVEFQYTRPVVDDSLELNIQNGRHPVVEKMLPLGKFVPNHCVLSSAEKDYKQAQLMIITGPNMAGKSTYMRQVALIALMAQMGSFVPATYARVGLVDGIYARVGAVDDLSSGQSTFMVEMNETAQILNGSTRRSLVLLDEVGRGTSTYDGVAIAWAVSEYIVNKIGCRTLFATHYHELNVLETTNPKIQNYRVCVSETEGHIEFLHTVEPGTAQKSYGIQVARMAGVPNEVIVKAGTMLNMMQKKATSPIAVAESRQAALKEPPQTPQLNLFSVE